MNNIEPFDKQKYIVKLLKENKQGVSIETIIDFLDYINKIRYEKEDLIPVLQKLISDKKVSYKDEIYKIAPME